MSHIQMLSCPSGLIPSDLSILQGNFFSKLSPEQEKILIITGIALSILAILVTIYRYFSRSVSTPPPLPTGGGANLQPQPEPLKQIKIGPAIALHHIKLKGRVIENLLKKIEDSIKQIEDNLQFERQRSLSLTGEDLPAIVKEDLLADIKKNMIQLEEELKAKLEEYPKIFRLYLEQKFTSADQKGYKEKQIIYNHTAMFTDYMKLYRDHSTFVFEGLKEIHSILQNTFFISDKEMCLHEQKKIDFIIFHNFFSVVEEHFDFLNEKDPELALKLKIKLANLPLLEDRSKFPKILLTQHDQLNILVREFQKEEDEQIDEVIKCLKTNDWDFTNKKEVRKLAKIVSSSNRSYLSLSNRAMLQIALKTTMGMDVSQSVWENPDQIHDKLCQITSGKWKLFIPKRKIFTDLHRTSKAKKFFENQQSLTEEEIQIPRWYHATQQDAFNSILKGKGKILVQKIKGYKGVWVSNQREEYGDFVFVLPFKIIHYDQKPSIQTQKGKINWRGLQHPIPLQGQTVPNLVYVGLKKKKKTLVESIGIDLAQKGIAAKIFSVDLVDRIQKKVIKEIGNPNLPEGWWGKAELV